jgi:hypothetical protein
MISADDIRAILAQYEKFGWSLERVLLSDGLAAALGDDSAEIFVKTPVEHSDLDAAWFTRRSNDGTAWELRILEAFPFAYVVVIADDMANEEREDILRSTEEKLRERKIRTAAGLSTYSETDS